MLLLIDYAEVQDLPPELDEQDSVDSLITWFADMTMITSNYQDHETALGQASILLARARGRWLFMKRRLRADTSLV